MFLYGSMCFFFRFSLHRVIDSSFINSLQHSTMTSSAGLERSLAASRLVCSPGLINYQPTWWFFRGGMIWLVWNGCHWLTLAKEMKNDSVGLLVWLTSKLEILASLYSQSVNSAGQRLQQWRRGQENKYSWRTNTWLKWREQHCSAPSTVRVRKTTTYCKVHKHFQPNEFVFPCQPTLRAL